jgi:hypothetical protein
MFNNFFFSKIVHGGSKTTNTYSEYLILVAFPQRKFLHERVLVSRYTYISRLIVSSHEFKMSVEVEIGCLAFPTIHE